MVKFLVSALICAIATLTSGCSADSARRYAFESLQGAGEQQCLKTMSSHCDAKESYDEYQRKRAELESPGK
jgi:hypothetical protein